MIDKNKNITDEIEELLSECASTRSPSRTMGSLSRMEAIIGRLFEESGIGVGQAPAMSCGVMLIGGVKLDGSLSTTPEGGLRLLFTHLDGESMTEVFFDYDSVVAVAVHRPIKVDSGHIILG